MRKAKSNVIEIKEEVQVGDIILEKGDRIKIIEESAIQDIEDSASILDHSWIILDALKNDPSPDKNFYLDTIKKIKDIEDNYTSKEIEDGNLLFDIW